MERRKDGRIYLKSYLKYIIPVRDWSQCLDEATSFKSMNTLKSCPSGLADGTTHCHLLLGDKVDKAMELRWAEI